MALSPTPFEILRTHWVDVWESHSEVDYPFQFKDTGVGNWLYLQMVGSKDKRLYKLLWWLSQEKGLDQSLEQVGFGPEHWLDVDLSEGIWLWIVLEGVLPRGPTCRYNDPQQREPVWGGLLTLGKGVSEWPTMHPTEEGGNFCLSAVSRE